MKLRIAREQAGAPGSVTFRAWYFLELETDGERELLTTYRPERVIAEPIEGLFGALLGAQGFALDPVSDVQAAQATDTEIQEFCKSIATYLEQAQDWEGSDAVRLGSSGD